MSDPWLSIVGIGEEGMASLTSTARKIVEAAEVIIGGDRHHQLAPEIEAERIAWPSPFDALIEILKSFRGRRVVVLATGDPLWYSVGARIARSIPPDQIRFFPGLSAFQWAACRMGWSLADVETLTAHGRPAAQIIPWFWPGARLLVLTSGTGTPGELARLLSVRGYGESLMTVLANLGGPEENRTAGTAGEWAAEDPQATIPPFHILAIECKGTPSPLLSRLPGLPDEAFEHDGKMTKRETRAVTLSHLMPARGEILWDIGTGCGSIAIEWMRAAPDAIAVGFDSRADRLEMARRNAETLGTPRLTLIEGCAPSILGKIPEPVGTKPDLRSPNAVFIGGGLGDEVVACAWDALGPGGRLVANAVTLESEAHITALHGRMGGTLTRLSVARAEPVGRLTGWRPMMPVTQWSLQK